MIRRAVPVLLLAHCVCIGRSDLFQHTAVWDIQLSFTREQFRSMQPITDPDPRAVYAPGEPLQGPEGKRNGLAAARGVEFPRAHGDVAIGPDIFRDVAVRYKGNGTYFDGQEAGKFSYKIDLNEFVKGQSFEGVAALNLHSNVTDVSWMNEALAFRLYRDAGVPAPRTSYARVHLAAGAEPRYLGLYSLVENVDRAFIRRNFATPGGALFKPVSANLFQYLGEDWAKYNQTYDPKDRPDAAQKKRLIDFTRLVSRTPNGEFAARIGSFLDLEAFARYMAVMVFLSDLDGLLGPGQNFYLYLDPKTEKFTFIPWDQDHSFGQLPDNLTESQRARISIHKPWIGTNRFLERMFAVKAFKSLYVAKLAEFNQTLFVPSRFTAQVDEIAPAIRPAVAQESTDKLESFDQAVDGRVRRFVTARTRSIAGQLAGRSRGQIPVRP